MNRFRWLNSFIPHSSYRFIYTPTIIINMPRPHNNHVLLILFPAQGHINPAFQFAKQLIALGAHVTLSTTLHMHNRITNKPTLPGLSYLPFSDGYDNGFKPTADTPYSLYTSELQRHGSQFLTKLILSKSQQGHPFTSLVYSLLLTWAADVASELHLPSALLWVQPATVFDILYSHFHGSSIQNPDDDVDHQTVLIPKLSLLLKPSDLPSFILAKTTQQLFVLSLFQDQFNLLDAQTSPTILVNSFEELEPEAFRAVDNFNIIPIGPLIPSAFLDGKDPNDTSFGGHIFEPSHGCVEWLDSKLVRSVVYVSFGSFCVLSKRQKEEIARALLDSGFPFLWVIREEDTEEEEELSCREELELKGKIVKWCSQLEILSHPSLGCFVTHCGWNSTMESLVCGVPVVAFPQFSDQPTNAKLIEDAWKIGVRVDRDQVSEDGILGSGEIRRCLELVMGCEEEKGYGEELRKNAQNWKRLAIEAVKEGGPSENNLRAFLDE